RDLYGLGERGTDLVGDGHRVLGPRDVVEEDREFVPSHPAGGIRVANRRAEAPRDLEEEVIPGVVSVMVVDRLETVQVDEEEGEAPLLPPGPGHGTLEPIEEQGAIGQGRQGIIVGEALEALLEPAPLGDVAENGDDANGLAARAGYGGDGDLLDERCAVGADGGDLASPAFARRG